MSQKKLILTILIFLLLFDLAKAFEFKWEITYPTIGPIFLPKTGEPFELLPKYILYIWQVFSIIAVLLAFFAIVTGGILYFSSFGNIGKMMEAKDKILSAFIGILILIGGYFIFKAARQEFVRIEIGKINIPFDEIEEGIWLCNEDIKVKDNFLSGKTAEYNLSFETYLLMKDVIKRDWLNESLAYEKRKTIVDLLTKVRKECIRMGSSGDTPLEFRKPQWIYFAGNYGAILHVFPNFKGYCFPYILFEKPRIDGPSSTYAGYSANEIYEDLVFAGGLPERFFSFEVATGTVKKIYPGGQEQIGTSTILKSLPKFSVTVFLDYRLNYIDKVLEKKEVGYYPDGGKITFYSLRDFNEGAAPKYQKPNSLCPKADLTGEQPCSLEFAQSWTKKVFNPQTGKEEEVGIIKRGVKKYNLTINRLKKEGGQEQIITENKEVQIDVASVPEELKRPYAFDEPYIGYSVKIQSVEKKDDQKEEIKEGGWIGILWGPLPRLKPSGEKTLLERILESPQYWCDIFDQSDRNFEDNYVSYFCESKARAKRYPCFRELLLLPGKIIDLYGKR